MKLITWNIQWGLGMDGRLDLARIVAEARRLADFDVLCLQEVADGFDDLERHGRTSLRNLPRCFRNSPRSRASRWICRVRMAGAGGSAT